MKRYWLLGRNRNTCWIQWKWSAFVIIPSFDLQFFFEQDASNILLSGIAYQFSSMLNSFIVNQITRPLASFFLHRFAFFFISNESLLVLIVFHVHSYAIENSRTTVNDKAMITMRKIVCITNSKTLWIRSRLNCGAI